MLLSQMDLQDSYYGSFDIIGLRIRSIVNVDWKPTTWDFNNRSTIEVFWKFLSLESGWRDDNLHVGTLETDIFNKSQNDIGV